MIAFFLALACAPHVAPPTALPAEAPGYDAIYFAMVDRFYNGDPANDGEIDPADPQAFHGGDLAGMAEKLPYLESLGIKTVWLSPVFQMRTEKFIGHGAFHGYWVQDLGQVEPRFGTEEELASLSGALHAREMRLYLDMIYNHVSFDAPLAEEHPDWFHPALPIEDWDDPVQVVEREVHGLKDFNQSNPEVYDYLLSRSLRWVQAVQPDGFRIDAVRHMPLAFQAQIMKDLRDQSGRPLESLGEFFDGDPGRLAGAWREGQFDAVFDFPLRYAMVDVFCKGRTPGRIGAVLSADGVYPDSQRIATFLDNHDVSRVSSECGGDVEKVGNALDFLTLVRGVPVIYQGTEVGALGEGEPANRADMQFGLNHPLEIRLRSGLLRRRAHTSLTQGVTRLAAFDEGLLVMLRHHPDESALIYVNQRAESVEYQGKTLAPGVGVRFLSGSAPPAIQPREVRVRLEAPPGHYRLVGTGPALGNWAPEQGLALDTNLEATLSVPAPALLEFKVVRLENGENPVWQEGENRYLFADYGEAPLEASLQWSD